jgi:hypothetical protein
MITEITPLTSADVAAASMAGNLKVTGDGGVEAENSCSKHGMEVLLAAWGGN